MSKLAFIDNGNKIVPTELLLAAQDPAGFIEVHLSYWSRYGGQCGAVTYRDAYEFLVADLEDHRLPVRWKSYESFKTIKSRPIKR